MAGPKGLVLTLFVFALLGRARDALQISEHGGADIPVSPHVSQVGFAYSEVTTRFSVSVLCAVENAKNPRRRSSVNLHRLVLHGHHSPALAWRVRRATFSLGARSSGAWYAWTFSQTQDRPPRQ